MELPIDSVKIGNNARKFIIEKFSMKKILNNFKSENVNNEMLIYFSKYH
jgi:hypothetical protein